MKPKTGHRYFLNVKRKNFPKHVYYKATNYTILRVYVW